MKVERFKNGVLGVNTYFLIADNGDAVCIDCGEKYERTLKAAEELGVKIKAILLTHAHFDHSAAGKRFQNLVKERLAEHRGAHCSRRLHKVL